MVTTRGGTETPGAPKPTPRSSTRKTAGKRELESLETPTQTKRQRKTAPASGQKKKEAKKDVPVEEASQDASEDVSDTIVVAAPSIELPQTPASNDPLPLRRRTSPKATLSRTSPEEDNVQPAMGDFHTPMQQPGSVYATPATHWKPRDEGSPTPKAARAKDEVLQSTSAKRGRGRPKKQQVLETPSKIEDEVPSSTYESEAAPIPSQESIPPSAQPEKTHRRFGSEEPTEMQDSPFVNRQGSKRYEAPEVSQVESATGDEDEHASDSDDEAPEVVTTAAASSKAAAAEAEAERAQKAAQAKEHAKRKAREELIAAQQAAKREREEKKAKKLAKKAAREQKAAATGTYDQELETDPRIDFDVSNGLLPASLLDTIDDQRPPTPPPERRGKTEEEIRKEKLNHHVKFLERTVKPVKDVKKGKLSVAVLAQQNKVMPPKMNKQTNGVREHWLKGRQVDRKQIGKGKVRFGKMERRPHGNRGFLRNGDD